MITEDDQLLDSELSEEDDWVDGEETTQLYEHFRFQLDRGQSPIRVDKYITDKPCADGSRCRICHGQW